MIDRAFAALGRKFGLTSCAGLVYGNLQGTLSALSSGKTCRSISIYVGAHEEAAPGMQESRTVSCANQIVSLIRAASGEANVYHLLTSGELEAVSLQNAGCVVAVNFSRDDEALAGIERFITEVLPQIAPLTRPQQCIGCGQMTGGQGVPVKIDDAIVPMHPGCAEPIVRMETEGTSLPKAIIGAVLGALIGGAAYALLYQVTGAWTGFFALLVFALAFLGYQLLKGPQGLSKVVTLGVSTTVFSLLGAVGGLWLQLHARYNDMHDFKRLGISASSAMKALYEHYDEYPDTLHACLIISLLLTLICATWLFWGYRMKHAANDRPRIVKGKI